MTDNDTPVFVTPPENRIPVNDYPAHMMDIPPSRMFLIKKGLAAYVESHPGSPIYDASQGDGGASLPGVPPEILDEANALQVEHGTGYDSPFGSTVFRQSVVEDYWQLDADTGLGPANVLAGVGGRDALVKAYSAMIHLGHGRVGDVVVVSRVPWISYNWGPYGIGANVMLAPGDPADGWAYTPEAIRATVEAAEKDGRKVAGFVITNPDNPTGNTISVERQVDLARTALEAGSAFVLFDWMYHFVTDEQPMNLNTFIKNFSPEERERLMWLDGLTKSLGASNIRNAHLIASKDVISFISARASHGVIPHFYGQAVAMAAYKMGYRKAAASIIEPTNASRAALRDLLEEHGFTYILGKGYYAFIEVGEWLRAAGWDDTAEIGKYLAEQWGVAIVPGVYFSRYGKDWIRFSYATPVERTRGAFERLIDGLDALASK
jgi:aspartate/methionine/tyrosine aminotransferase